jgi:hypothetical protein
LAVLLSLLAVSCLSCGKSSNGIVGDGGDDPDPVPTTVEDLSVSAVSPVSASLRWTAPAVGSGMAYAYEVRYATSPIAEGSWSSAGIAPGPPAPLPAGMTQTMVVASLAPQTPYHFALKSRSAPGIWSRLSNVAVVTTLPEAEIVIPDSSLQAVVRELISKPSGPIRTSDIIAITEIRAEEMGIVSLSGLEAFTSLQVLHIRGNHVEDLSPLAGLSGMITITASENEISDIGPLANLTNLETLTFGNNRIAEIDVLAGLPNLTSLYLNGNRVAGISALTSLTELTYLYLAANLLTDVKSLQGLANLQSLSLDVNQITDLAPLVANAGLAAGDVIWVRMNPLSQEAIQTQIPALQARGVTVHGPTP